MHIKYLEESLKPYPSNRTSAKDLFNDITSLAIKLNWLILNFSFMIASFSGGMWTALPISPGRPATGKTVGAGRHLFSSDGLYVPRLKNKQWIK